MNTQQQIIPIIVTLIREMHELISAISPEEEKLRIIESQIQYLISLVEGKENNTDIDNFED